MTLEPLLNASPAVQIHAVAATSAFVLGIAQLLAPKGRRLHMIMGWSWAMLMFIVAGSSFWIHHIRTWGDWSAIHLLSISVFFTLPLGIYFARTGGIRRHQRTMTGIFLGALVIAGLFTFVPGRLMHSMFF